MSCQLLSHGRAISSVHRRVGALRRLTAMIETREGMPCLRGCSSLPPASLIGAFTTCLPHRLEPDASVPPQDCPSPLSAVSLFPSPSATSLFHLQSSELKNHEDLRRSERSRRPRAVGFGYSVCRVGRFPARVSYWVQWVISHLAEILHPLIFRVYSRRERHEHGRAMLCHSFSSRTGQLTDPKSRNTT